MPFIDGGSESREIADAAEYSRARSHRHHASSHSTGRKTRVAYFGLASVWGYLIGAGGVLGAMQAQSPASIPAGSGLVLYLGGAFVIAVAGGALIAGGYHETRKRARK
jgi:hypothetical protein